MIFEEIFGSSDEIVKFIQIVNEAAAINLELSNESH